MSNELKVWMVLRPLDLTQIAAVRSFQPVMDEQKIVTRWLDLKREMEELPLTLRHTSLEEMNLSMHRLNQWRVTSQTEANYQLMLGELPVSLCIPASRLKPTCSDCGRPLALFLVSYEWITTWMGKPETDPLASHGTWCPMCKFKRETIPSLVKRNLAELSLELRSGARKGWGVRLEEAERKEKTRLMSETVKQWNLTDAKWWGEQRRQKSDLYKEYIALLEKEFQKKLSELDFEKSEEAL